MEKTIQVEAIATYIRESLGPFEPQPKMYHPEKDLISIPLVVDGVKIVVEIKKID